MATARSGLRSTAKRGIVRIAQPRSAASDVADNREELRVSTKLMCGELGWSFAGTGQNDEQRMITICFGEGAILFSICYNAAHSKNGLTIFLESVKIVGSGLEGYPSGQRDQTVNLTALPSKVRILLPPPIMPQVVVFSTFFVAGGFCGCSSMVELKPSKLKTRVRFPSPAPGCV